MPVPQRVGLILIGVGIVDTAVGHLVVAPRIPDQMKRSIVKMAFSLSGIGIVAVGVGLFSGHIKV